ncbi:sigma-54-dependent Fis family transcriptional regulator [bacterium]|nr:sigma-54-dependent Fis family transcriptional regulator [bacterium]
MTVPAERKNILIVDDEPTIRESLKLILSRNFKVVEKTSGEEVLDYFNQNSLNVPDLVLMDVVMPGINGVELLGKVKELHPRLPVIMLSANRTVKTAVEAMKCGAIDYLNKPFDVDELLTLIDQTLTKSHFALAEGSAQQTALSHTRVNAAEAGPGIVGQSQAIQSLYQRINQVSAHDVTVLITGESGSGKELIAQEIHRRSPRANQPFVAINCAAIPETLIESELFGHEKGAFTHAGEKRLGHFELANGGTLFLDEIGELRMQVQVKMLRFLQEQEFYRVGSSKPTKVNVRVIAATNSDLEKNIAQGKFREDLFYRINVVPIQAPTLRSHPEDIANLFEYFVQKFSKHYPNKSLNLTSEALNALKAYPWPGNVRELENMVESLLALSTQAEVHVTDLPSRFLAHEVHHDINQQVLEGRIGFEEAEAKFERDLIVKALQKSDFIQTRAAEILGISRRILKYKMDKLGIITPDDAS